MKCLLIFIQLKFYSSYTFACPDLTSMALIDGFALHFYHVFYSFCSSLSVNVDFMRFIHFSENVSCFVSKAGRSDTITRTFAYFVLPSLPEEIAFALSNDSLKQFVTDLTESIKDYSVPMSHDFDSALQRRYLLVLLE